MKSLKFLNIGTLAVLVGLGLISNQTQAVEIPLAKNNFIQEINEILKEENKKGFIANYDVNTKIADVKKMVIDGEEYEFLPNLDENVAQIARNFCKVTVTFDKNGNTLNLSGNYELKEITNFTNETQKKIMREFIALHEVFHCELANIENPIVVEGQTKEFNKKLNYYIKDIQSETDKNEKVSYFGTLSETFGDIGAIGLLLKRYGQDNEDLNFVIKSVHAQRYVGYFNTESDTHFTHVAIGNTLNEDVARKLIQTPDAETFREEVLKISNQAVQQLITQRKDLAKTMFSTDKLESSIKFHIVHEIINKSKDLNLPLEIMQKFRVESKEHGFVRNLSNQFLQDEDISDFKNTKVDFDKEEDKSIKIANKLLKYSKELYSDKKYDILYNNQLKEYENITKEFKRIIFQQNESKINFFDSKPKKSDVANRMLMIKAKFLDSNKNNNNNNNSLRNN